MASRIFWILMVGVALIGGAAMQGGLIFDWSDDHRVERATEARVEARVDNAVDQHFDRMRVVGSDGRTIDVSPQTKRELGGAVRRLVAAEAELALLRIDGDNDAAMREARSRSESARADVERLKAQLEREKQLSERDRDAVRTQIQQEIRESVRSAIRD